MIYHLNTFVFLFRKYLERNIQINIFIYVFDYTYINRNKSYKLYYNIFNDL